MFKDYLDFLEAKEQGLLREINNYYFDIKYLNSEIALLEKKTLEASANLDRVRSEIVKCREGVLIE